MDMYRDSLQCKYCEHYSALIDSCHLHSHPTKICEFFTLSPMEVMLSYTSKREFGTPARRKDGSYIVSINDVPSVKAELDREKEQKKIGIYIFYTVCILIGAFFALLIISPFISLITDILNFFS